MPKRMPAFLAETPAPPKYAPVRQALENSKDPETAAALRLFVSMPPSTGILANPVRYQHTVACGGESVDLSVRSFSLRGSLLEEDIVNGSADLNRVIFVGLFGRFARPNETRWLSGFLSTCFHRALKSSMPELSRFIRRFPTAPPEVAIQYMASLRKAAGAEPSINRNRPPDELLIDLLTVHLTNVAVGATASYMRSAGARKTENFIASLRSKDPFPIVFGLLLRRAANSVEAPILARLGCIQVHHGSAGSNMVARYLASLHTKSVSDFFTASQMALDSARHFGAISDMSVFIGELEAAASAKRDEMIRQRIMRGDLPTFGHPEIAAAGRGSRIELDPRPSIYLRPLFDGIDRGRLPLSDVTRGRLELAQRIYQVAFVEGVRKPGATGNLRLTPNTDFGAWIVQEALGIEEPDRTLLSYAYRGFGWMMDAREQLQQPIIRPVIPPDPAIIPAASQDTTITDIVTAVHLRLQSGDAFRPIAR